MPQIRTSEDVYRHLVEESDDSWLFGLVAFALIEEQRMDWMKHYVAHNGGQQPSAVDIQHWYQQQPESVLRRAKGEAESALKLYADDVLQEVLDAERKEVADSLIVSEIRLARRFWPQFGINVAGGFASALLFAVLLGAFAFIVLTDSSPVEMGKQMLD